MTKTKEKIKILKTKRDYVDIDSLPLKENYILDLGIDLGIMKCFLDAVTTYNLNDELIIETLDRCLALWLLFRMLCHGMECCKSPESEAINKSIRKRFIKAGL